MDALVQNMEENEYETLNPMLKDSTSSQLQRGSRDRQPSTWYSSNKYEINFIDCGEPESFHEAIEYEHKKEWIEAM